MAIKVIAQRREVKLGKNPGMKFVMRPDLYIPIAEKKVFAEASTHSGISAGVIKAAWDAAGEVLRTWATEGHSVLPPAPQNKPLAPCSLPLNTKLSPCPLPLKRN